MVKEIKIVAQSYPLSKSTYRLPEQPQNYLIHCIAEFYARWSTEKPKRAVGPSYLMVFTELQTSVKCTIKQKQDRRLLAISRTERKPISKLTLGKTGLFLPDDIPTLSQIRRLKTGKRGGLPCLGKALINPYLDAIG